MITDLNYIEKLFQNSSNCLPFSFFFYPTLEIGDNVVALEKDLINSILDSFDHNRSSATSRGPGQRCRIPSACVSVSVRIRVLARDRGI
jgi:hypothetical protein